MTDRKKKMEHAEPENRPDMNDRDPEAMFQPEEWEMEAGKEESESHKESHKFKKDNSLERITELELSLIEMADKHLRLQAEFDNFRKRTLKEKAELIKSGGETVLSGILPIIDDFDRALVSMKDVAEDDPAKIGFLLIFSKFKEFMRQHNIKEIEAAGNDFDVDLHYALTKIPAPADNLKGKVVDVIEKGYLLNDKVLRHAKVIIGE